MAFMLCAGMGARVLEAGVDWGGANAADWFQAVGSVAAVAAAIWTAWNAGQQTRMAAKAETVRTVELVCSIGYMMDDLAAAAWNEFKEGSPLLPENFTQIMGLFDAFPIDRYPSGEMALRLASIHRLMMGFAKDYTETVEIFIASDAEIDSIPTKHRKSAISLFARTKQISAEYDQLVSIGQKILDHLPGRRIVIPHGRKDSSH